MKKNEAVIVLHGLGRTRFSMLRLTGALRSAGYTVFDWGYASTTGGLAAHVATLRPKLAKLDGFAKVHGVGHSLGGLVLRGLFSDAQLPLGRLVLLGTPNAGAEIINKNSWLFSRRPFNRPIINDLAAGSPAILALPVPPMEIGVIAGVEPFNMFNPASWVNKWTLGDVPHDGTVTCASARLPGKHTYLEVPANHSFLPLDKGVTKAVVSFITEGKFA